MKQLKEKILACITMLLAGIAILGAGTALAAEDGYQTIVIRPENFLLEEGSSAVIEGTQWNVDGTNALEGMQYTINNNQSGAGAEAVAQIPVYIKEDGNYRMFVMLRDVNDKTQTRLMAVGIDDQFEYFGGKLLLKDHSNLKTQAPESYMNYVAPLPNGVTLGTVGYYWDGAPHNYADIPEDQLQMVDGVPVRYDHQTFALAKGLHQVKIKNEFVNYKNGRIAAVLITNNPAFETLEDYSVPNYDGQPRPFKEAMDTLSDTAAPAFSQALSAGEIGENAVTVRWNTADTDVVCMEVSINGSGETVGYYGENSYTFTGLRAASAYTLGVRLMDQLGQYSYQEIQVTTAGSQDTEPPVLSGTLTAEADGTGSIKLSWNQAEDNRGVAKYVVYLDGTGPENQVKEIPSDVLQAEIQAQAGKHQIYVCAVDYAGNVSNMISAEVMIRKVANIMLRPDNFTYETMDKGWAKSTENRISFGDRAILGKESAQDQPAKARVYLEQGRYRIMAYVLDPIASPGSRPFTLTINGVQQEYEFAKKGIKDQSNQAQKDFYDYWDTGFLFDADETGLYEIEVHASAVNVKLYGILITGNEEEDADGLTAQVTAGYEDTEAPEKPEWTIAAAGLNEARINVTGDGAAYEVLDEQGNPVELIDGADGTGVIGNIRALKWKEYTVIAYDAHGNAASGDKKPFYMSPVLPEWTISEKDGSVTLDYQLKGNCEKAFSGVVIFAVYGDDGACMDYVVKEHTVSGGEPVSGTLELKQTDFTQARAMLWDNTDGMHPLALSAEFEK